MTAALSLGAQTVYIQGYAHGGEGKKILVKTFDDYISGKEMSLTSALIDSNGYFSISFPLNETIYAWFEVEYYVGEMYLEPGTHHKFTLNGLVFNDVTDKINGNLEQMLIDVVPDTGDMLNQKVRLFNQMSNRVLIANMDNLMGRTFYRALDSLQKVCDSMFSDNKNEYFSSYIRYRLASFYLMNLQSSTNGLFFRYLYHQPVLYSNIEYMSFFGQYYENYFSVVNRPFGVDDLRLMVNTGATFPALLDSLGADTLLQNEVLREMVLLESLKNILNGQGYKRSSVERILTGFAGTSKFEIHRKIAANILEMAKRFEPGEKAVDFSLISSTDDTVHLSDFRGKMVYIHFFTTWNTASLAEMEVMRKLHTKYSQSIQFISICCDREYMKMYHFVRDNRYPWPVVHFNNDYTLLEAMGVKTYPYFMLIDGNGCYIENAAESPSGNIEGRFNKILGVE